MAAVTAGSALIAVLVQMCIRDRNMEIERWNLDDLDADLSRVGLDASGVCVDEIRPSKKKRLQIQMFFDQYHEGDFDDILREIQRIK